MDIDETACPDCAETIKAAAKVCKHCGYRYPITSLPTERDPSIGEECSPPAANQQEATPGDSSSASQIGWWDRNFEDGAGAMFGCTVFPAILLVALVLGFAFWPVKKVSDTPSAAAAPPSESTDESKAIDVATAAKMNLKAKVKDGDSARFESLIVSNSGGALWALCGRINSKNGFGAYTGFKPFVAFADPEAPTIIRGESSGLGDDMDRQLYAAANQQFCGNIVAHF